MNRRHFIKQTTAASLTFALTPIACTAKLDTEVLILGGGISGLYLAYQLEKAGKDYILLEGSERLGGRLFTREDLNRDVGGRGIGDRYIEIMKLVEDLNIELIDITSFARSKAAVYLNGKLYSSWPDPKSNPRMLEFGAVGNAPQLNRLDGWFQRPDLDETYSELLKRQGRTEEEIDLINISANYNDVRETSAINSYHSRAFRKFNGTKKLFNFKGGTITFVNAIANSLSGPKYINKFVTSIQDSGKKVVVTCQDNSQYSAKKVVSTLPLTTLRDVEMNVALNPNQKKAINELSYTLITQIHLHPTAPFWKDDETPMSMWTDTPLERVMNISPDPNNPGIVCWVNGKGTTFFDKMSDAEIADYTLKKFKEIRPASEGKLEYLGTHNWGKYPFNKGAYVEFGVGQAAWFKDLIQPAGNMHFAGEHAARNSRGIEGAAESAKRVFNELIT